MAASDEEDVVVENSALYHHLRENGFTDFEVLPKKDDDNDITECVPATKRPFTALTNYLQNKIKTVSHNFNDALNTGFSKAFKTVEKANHESLQLIMEHVYNSKVLLDEDVTFLQNFTNDSLTEDDRSSGPSSQKVLTSAACLSAYGIGKTLLSPWCLRTTFTEVTEASLISLTGGYIAYTSMQWLFSSIYNGLVFRGLSSFSEMLQILKEETVMIKKCLTMIQEAELVARGFMLPSIAVPTCRLELSRILPIQSPERQCPELRESVFCWTREAFKRHREATLCLLETCPLQEELDVPSIYLACASMSEFGRLVELDPSLEEEKKLLLEESEHFSLSSLKAIFQLMALQRSEFLRRLTLCFLPESSPCAASPFSVLNTLRRISSIIQDVTDSSRDTLERLKKTHNYYKSMWSPRISAEPRSSEEKLPPYLKNLQVSVHSVGLHLQAALMRVNGIEEQIEQIGNDQTGDELLKTDWSTDLFTKFHEIRAELDASKSCLDDGEMVFNSACLGKNAGSKLDLPLKIEIKPHTPTVGAEIPIISNEEPTIEDQVFEAYVSNEEQPQECFVDYDFPNAIDKEKRKKELESSARLFKELKNVLVAKAEEHRIREEKALGITKDDEETKLNGNETKSPPLSREGLHLDLNSVFQNGNMQLNEKDECGNYEQYDQNDLSNSDSGYSLSAKTLSANKGATVTNDQNENLEYISCDVNGKDHEEEDDDDDTKLEGESAETPESASPDEYMNYVEGALEDEVEYSDSDYYLEDTEALDKKLENLFSRSQKLFASSVAKMAAEKSRAMGLEETVTGDEEFYGETGSDEEES